MNAREFTFSSEWVRVFGPDAKDFLHRLTTVDFRNLLPTETAAGFFLSAPGKIRAGFYVYAMAPGEYLFRVPFWGAHRWTERLLETIDQMTFAEKMTVERLTPAWSRDLLGDQTPTADATRIDWGTRDYGHPWITEISLAAGTNAPAALPAIPAHDLERLRIEARTPNWSTEIVPDANPLELGLTTFIAENKGCYPGQEVIEKIISLGSPAKRLSLLRRRGSESVHASIGDAVFFENASVGTLTSIDGPLALALLRRNALGADVLTSSKIVETPGDNTGITDRAEWDLVKQ